MHLLRRPAPTFEEEIALWEKGIKYVIGVDEVGRGAFAGPIVAAAVIFPLHFNPELLKGVHDSKLVIPQKRIELAEVIKTHALLYSISEISVDVINEKGIGIANQRVIQNAVKSILSLHTKTIEDNDYYLLVDGITVPHIKPQKAIIEGDRKSLSIAAASILAKVYRDSLMCNLDVTYPGYEFSKHKGYGTLLHKTLMQSKGISPIHRTSFRFSSIIAA